MSEQKVVEAYLEGRIGSWALYRKLVKLGVSVGTALTLAVGLPAVVRGDQTLDDLAARAKQTSQDDDTEIQRLLKIVARALEVAVRNGNINPLAVGVARLGVNVDVAPNESIKLNLSGRPGQVPLNLVGLLANLGERQGSRTMQLMLGGNFGNLPLNLAGNVDVPSGDNLGGGGNIGKANLNFVGNAGRVPLNFSGNLGRLVTTPQHQRLTPGPDDDRD